MFHYDGCYSHPGRCRPSEWLLSILVFPWIQPLSQSEWIRCLFFISVSYVVTSCVWSTIQCQGSHSHRERCILWHCLDLGDYPRVSRHFLINHAYRVRSFVMRCFIMMVIVRHPGRCRPSESLLSLIVLSWNQPLSQSEWIGCPYCIFPCLCCNELCVVDYSMSGESQP